jgi:hypothetical protein
MAGLSLTLRTSRIACAVRDRARPPSLSTLLFSDIDRPDFAKAAVIALPVSESVPKTSVFWDSRSRARPMVSSTMALSCQSRPPWSMEPSSAPSK